jgi:hypothetical protein
MLFLLISNENENERCTQGCAANFYFLVESKTVFAHIYPVFLTKTKMSGPP